MEEIKFSDGRTSEWWGYNDYFCFDPNFDKKILLPYKGETAFGDSYHNLIIDSKTISGYIWSGYLLWSKCGNYFTCDWCEGMKGEFVNNVWHSTQIQRATIVVSPKKLKYRIVVRPSHEELDALRREGKENDFWDYLIKPKWRIWKNFR